MTDISFLGATPFERVKALMARLRNPENGCPWDVEQTFETIAPYTIEEAYEVCEAIAQNDMSALREELGDLMMQVVFHSQMADEAGDFDLDAVCDGLTRKMVRRHPHVFGGGDDRTAAEQTVAWEEIKAAERAEKSGSETDPTPPSVLDNVPLAFPALTRAHKLQKRAARVGFDWPDTSGVLDKITEEAGEVAEAASQNDPDAIEDEIGDLLFAVTNLARHLDIDPEKALRRTNRKFTRRFQFVETSAQTSGQALSDMTLEQLEALWQAAKKAE